MVQQLIENRLCNFSINHLGWKTILETADGMTHSDVVKACEDAAKEAVLEDRRQIQTTDLRKVLMQRRRP
jgi:AAA+ superfamily predicted ATPase